MDKKDPIPFRARRREKRAARAQRTVRRPPGPRRPSAHPGELDDMRAYWTHFLKSPLGGGRFYWTDRMLWGNAIFTGLIAMIVAGVRIGFQPLTIITVGINSFFLFVLVYYLMPWVMDFLLNRLGVRQSAVDPIKLDVIALSGWLAIALLLRLVPLVQPFLYDAVLLWATILLFWAVRRIMRAPWYAALAATLGGVLSVVIVQWLLTYL